MNKIEGVYSITKNGTMVNLMKAGVDNELQSLDYFTFHSYLFVHFDTDRIQKILEHLNQRGRVIIDFDNERAMLVKDKDPNYLEEFAKEMSAQTVANFYMENDGNMDDNNYSKPILGDNKNVESLYRR